MKPMAFNLRDAKKVKTDGKTSTFKLGSGHEITILHKALPALQRKQIEKMPCCDGGEMDAMAEGGAVDTHFERYKIQHEGLSQVEHVSKAKELSHGINDHVHPDKVASRQKKKDWHDSEAKKTYMAKGGEIKPPKMEREDKGHGAVIHKEDAQSKELERMRKENDDLHKKIMEAHENIMKMANGGDVLPKHMKPPKNPKMEAVGINGHAAAYANGGKVDQDAVNDTTVRPDAGFGKVTLIDAEGGETPDPQQPWSPTTDYDKGNPSVPQIAKENYKKDTTDEVEQKYGKPPVKMYADGTEDQPVAQDDSAPVAVPDAPQPPAQAPVEPTTAMANMPVNTQVPPTPANANVLAPDNTVNAPAVVNLQQQGAREQQAVDSAKGASVANIQDGFNKQRAALAQRDSDNLANLKGHAEDFKQYINDNPINPNHYMESKSTLNKVGTAVTLFLGGLGARHGGSNPALDFINRQIDRDIDSQKARADQQRTIWGAYKDLYGDDTIANNMAKISLNDITTGKMNQAAAQLATPAAKANADAFTAQKAIENQKLLLDSSGRLGTLNSGGPGAPKNTDGSSAKNSQETSWDKDHILKPGAINAMKTAQFNVLDNDDKEKISHQLEGAALADKAIDAINKHFPAMYANVKSNAFDASKGNSTSKAVAWGANKAADTLGYLHKKGQEFEDVPYVGGAISGAVKAATNSQSNQDYDVDRDSMLSAMTSALVHSGMAPTEAHSTAMTFLPIEGNNPDLARKKMEAAKEKIRNVVKTDALEAHGLARSRKK